MLPNCCAPVDISFAVRGFRLQRSTNGTFLNGVRLPVKASGKAGCLRKRGGASRRFSLK